MLGASPAGRPAGTVRFRVGLRVNSLYGPHGGDRPRQARQDKGRQLLLAACCSSFVGDSRGGCAYVSIVTTLGFQGWCERRGGRGVRRAFR